MRTEFRAAFFPAAAISASCKPDVEFRTRGAANLVDTIGNNFAELQPLKAQEWFRPASL
ncbi:MAG: hypothetical protein OXC26_22750 [Albidovulum sp.]|nr:hypothetical protein [Albidovulum sp.]